MGQNDARAGRRDEPLDFVLDLLHEGVCVTDTDGRIQWSNQAFRQWDTPLAEMVMSLAQRAARRVGAGETSADRPIRYTAHERTGDGRHAEVVVTPVFDSDGKLARLMATVIDRTAQVVLQQKIQAIEEAGRKLLHLEPDSIARMTPSERLTMLQRQIITLTRNLLRFDHFRIRLRNPETNRLELVLTEGPHQTDESRELFAEKVGSGITGYVAATGVPYICNDVRSDPRYLPGLVDAQSSLTVPLWHNDKVVGIFNVEHHNPGAFGQQDLQALEIFSHYVAQALVTLQLLIAEKFSTSDQLASDVTVELSDPLNRILAATDLLKADYIGQDEQTTRRLDEISQAIDDIRRAVRQVTDLKRPIIGPTPLAPKASRPLAGRRLLVADDEPTIRDSLSTILSDLGATVDLARDGQEAVAMGRTNRYDLVLADIRMPQKNGYQVFTEIRQTDSTVPVVLMTAFGYDPSHSIVRACGEGLQAVLFKPFKIQVLYEQISQALGIEIHLPTADSGG